MTKVRFEVRTPETMSGRDREHYDTGRVTINQTFYL